MKPHFRWLAAIAVAAACGLAGYWYGHTRAGQAVAADQSDAVSQHAEGAESPVTVAVQTAPIVRGTLRRQVTVYGTVMAQPGDVTIVSVPFESRIGHLNAIAGQDVTADEVLGEIGPSPDTLLQVRQATAALDAAKLDMAQIHQRFNSHLATNSDLLQSKANLDLAQLKLDSFAGSGATGALQQIKAQSGGIISKIDVQEGQIVPGGGPLVEIATGRRIVARLGVQPEFVGMIHKGDPVGLSEVGTTSGETVAGVAELVTKRVNSDTRLVDVFVSLPENAPLMLDGFVQGSLTVASAQGLVVPRSAVLPEDGAYSLFTVKDGRAMKHAVTMGLSDEKEAEIVGEGLKEGDVVVIEGNLELDDGMSVTVNPEATH